MYLSFIIFDALNNLYMFYLLVFIFYVVSCIKSDGSPAVGPTKKSSTGDGSSKPALSRNTSSGHGSTGVESPAATLCESGALLPDVTSLAASSQLRLASQENKQSSLNFPDLLHLHN